MGALWPPKSSFFLTEKEIESPVLSETPCIRVGVLCRFPELSYFKSPISVLFKSLFSCMKNILKMPAALPGIDMYIVSMSINGFRFQQMDMWHRYCSLLIQEVTSPASYLVGSQQAHCVDLLPGEASSNACPPYGPSHPGSLGRRTLLGWSG